MADRPRIDHHRAVCGEGDLALFMFGLARFQATVSDPPRFADKAGVERTWIAYTWQQWADDRGLSFKRVRRILEKGEDLAYIERARRAWGQHRVIRLHVTITDAYIAELTRCVHLGPKAYLKARKDARQQSAAATSGQDHIAHLGKTTLPTEGKTTLPTEGNYIKDSSLTLSETLSETAPPADAEGARPRSVRQKEHDFGEEKSMPLSPQSPPFPEPAQEVAGEDGASIATKLRDLGLLVEWQRTCAEFKCPSTEVPSAEQLAALGWWVRRNFSESSRPEEVLTWTVMQWPEMVSDFSTADDAQGLNLQQYADKPSLEFVRRVVGLLKAGKAAPPPD